MKVLRTALFSAFLMVCFMQMGYAQDLMEQIHVEMGSVSMTPTTGLCIHLQYSTSVTGSSGITKILYNGTVLHSESVSNGTVTVDTEICLDELGEILWDGVSPTATIWIDCETCTTGGKGHTPTCEKEGCVTTIDPDGG